MLHIRTHGPAPGTHVLRIEVQDPQGRLLRHYGQNVVCPEGQGQATIPLALNDAPGQWTVTARDVATGVSNRMNLQVMPGLSLPGRPRADGEAEAEAGVYFQAQRGPVEMRVDRFGLALLTWRDRYIVGEQSRRTYPLIAPVLLTENWQTMAQPVEGWSTAEPLQVRRDGDRLTFDLKGEMVESGRGPGRWAWTQRIAFDGLSLSCFNSRSGIPQISPVRHTRIVVLDEAQISIPEVEFLRFHPAIEQTNYQGTF
jgi:hypothetical protein